MSEASKDRQIPIALIIVGFILCGLAGLVRAGPAAPGISMAIAGLAAVIGVPLMLGAAFTTAYITKQSFGELPAAVLKLTAIYVMGVGVGMLVPFVGSLILAPIVMVVLLMWLFELDFVYALAFMVTFWLVNVVVGLIIRSMR